MSTLRPLITGICLFLLGATLPLAGQQLAFRRFGLRDGLPQSQVTALLEDRQGFLWVGTNTGGLARLGASGFHTHAPGRGLRALFVRTLLEDPQGSIWVASQEGVSELRGEVVLNYGPDQGLPAASFSALALDGEDRVLVANRHGLFRKQGEAFAPVPLPPPWAGRPLRRVVRDGASSLWLVDSQDRLAIWDDRGLRESPLPGAFRAQPLRDIQVDPQGKVWVLLEDALLRQEGAGWTQEPIPLGPLVKAQSLRFSPRGGFVVALGGDGILEKDAQGRFNLLNQSKGLPRDRILVALRDRRGVLWVGSDGDGLAAQSQPDLLAIESLQGGAAKPNQDLGAISSILELGGDRFLLSSSTGLFLVRFGQGITAHWTQGDGLPSNQCWGLLSDGKGGVWVGTDRGLALWREGRVRAAGPRSLSKAAATVLLRDGQDILVGGEQGLTRMDAGGRLLAQHRLPPEMIDGSITDLQRHGGQLLLATSQGLWELSQGQLRPVHTDAPFAQATVATLRSDRQGRLWVGTMRGLFLLRGGRWEGFGSADGLPDEGINFVAEVSPGRMAIGHSKGVSFIEGRRMQHLGLNQGLISEETNHDGFLLDSQGRLWIGMVGGACILVDAANYRNAALSRPRVLDLRWPSGGIPHPRSALLPPQPDFLSLTFDTGDPLVSTPVRYEALLLGTEREWHPVNQGQTLQYRNLGAGTYQFRLRGTTDGLAWVDGQPVSIEIRAAWHERWLVRGLLALGLVLLLGWILWLRVHTLAERSRRLEETIDERTLLLARQNRALEQAHGQIKHNLEGRLRLLDTVTHDLRSPLTTILLSLDRLREEAPDCTTLLDVMEHEAHRIEGLARNLLDQSRSESLLQGLSLSPIQPAEVTEGFEDVLRLKAEARNLGFQLDVSPDTQKVRIQADTATLHQVMLNLFENALKFTPAGGRVGIRSWVDQSRHAWVLEVWDTGRGLDETQVEELLKPFGQGHSRDAAHGWGLGLSICKSIVDAHEGTLEIDSQPGHGARFRVALALAEEA